MLLRDIKRKNTAKLISSVNFSMGETDRLDVCIKRTAFFASTGLNELKLRER